VHGKFYLFLFSCLKTRNSNEDEQMIELIYKMKYKDVQIQVIKGKISNLQVDAVMCPTNSYLRMEADVAKFLKEIGGSEIETEALNFLENYKDYSYLKDFEGSCPIGTAVITSAGKLIPNIKYVIHAPVINESGEQTKRTRILSAIRGVMQRAYEAWWKLGLNEKSNLCESIAIPGFKMGTERLSKAKISRAIIDGLVNQLNTWFVKAPLKKIILIDQDDELLQQHIKVLETLNE